MQTQDPVTLKETTYETSVGTTRYRLRIAAVNGRCAYYVKTEIYERGLLLWGSPAEERINVAMDRDAVLVQYDDTVANAEAIVRQHHNTNGSPQTAP